ncbi:hypothetical protein BpHYR1_008088 [Brachionus plicatilis]|uniref:Uncharacterized protein n=1 Tax=Brachionus plicatilis TaxID=10195 RepID=A0A3M7Q2R4_BRAPC|nr:hypothetical protein BpHYR1_008088 [Brachionus plicatilis]
MQIYILEDLNILCCKVLYLNQNVISEKAETQIISHAIKLESSPRCFRFNVIYTPKPGIGISNYKIKPISLSTSFTKKWVHKYPLNYELVSHNVFDTLQNMLKKPLKKLICENSKYSGQVETDLLFLGLAENLNRSSPKNVTMSLLPKM